MRKIEIQNPISYFDTRPYSECLVLSVRVSDADKIVEVVCDYFDLQKLLQDKMSNSEQNGSTGEKIREFHRITFLGVSNVERKNTTLRHGFQDFDAHSLNFGPGAEGHAAINYIAIKQDVDDLSAKVACHSGLGDYTFSCNRVSVDAISCRSVKVGPQQWEYYDVETGRHVEFKQPFGKCSHHA
ncbi:MAG: hypothetical protein QM758_04400 [Armatimonas sp.]